MRVGWRYVDSFNVPPTWALHLVVLTLFDSPAPLLSSPKNRFEFFHRMHWPFRQFQFSLHLEL